MEQYLLRIVYFLTIRYLTLSGYCFFVCFALLVSSSLHDIVFVFPVYCISCCTRYLFVLFVDLLQELFFWVSFTMMLFLLSLACDHRLGMLGSYQTEYKE